MDFSLELGTEVLRRTPEVLHALLADLLDDWTSGDEGHDTWSPCQVVGHLTFVDECDWIDRTRLIVEHGTGRVFDPAGLDRAGAGHDRLRSC